MKPRELAYDLLQRLEKNKQFSNIALDRALLQSNMSEADKGLTSALFYGVTERRLTIDYQISKLSSRPISELDMAALTALRMGIYQLGFMDRIPPHAAINETVALCPRRISGFVNAILRAFTRGSGMIYPDRDLGDAEYLSVRYSVGLPLVCRLIDDFGSATAEDILTGFNSIPETTISVNTLKISREELANKIDDSEYTRFSDTGLKVRGSVRNLYGFDNGSFFVQDEASQICVAALGAKAGETVLDICSCPGSKSFGAAIAMRDQGKILAFDLHEKKLPLVVSGAQRLGINIISVSKNDGRNFIPELEGVADRIICDVPCSGFGVLWKKPELRYKDPKESEALPDIQLSILNTACRYLKRGGTLVYSTCTILPEENEKNIERFLYAHPDFTLDAFSVGELEARTGYCTLFPHVHETDGFFIARLTRR